MNHIQLAPNLSVPERTAELASTMPGVMQLLGLGIDVLQYEDRRDLARYSGRLVTQQSIINSELYWGIGIGAPSHNQAAARMEP